MLGLSNSRRETGREGGMEVEALPTIRRALPTDSADPAEVGAAYRTTAVPEGVADEQLGRWYLDLDALTPVAAGVVWPDSCHDMINGASCWPRWIVHRSPSDMPGHEFAARLLVFGQPTPVVVTGATLDEVRGQLPAGLVRRESSLKEKTIVEAWDAF